MRERHRMSSANAADTIPINRTESTELKSGQKATFTFEPDKSGMAIDMVAISKFQGITYEFSTDDTQRFGVSPVPPTDVDDAVTTHNPRLTVERQLTVVVRNVSAVDRIVTAQIRGVEV